MGNIGNIIKITLKEPKRRMIAASILLFTALIGAFIWTMAGRADEISIGDSAVPLSGAAYHITAGDTVFVNITADALDSVYGYQFCINYDKKCLSYNNRLNSEIEDIATIFATEKEDYLLVGATMLGDAKGSSGENVPVCRVEFLALQDFDAQDITLSKVNIVTDGLDYIEDVSGWAAGVVVK